MEIEEYVRTDKGIILEINTSIDIDKVEFANGFIGKIVKHSKNIIDLIEVGDYVNGVKVDKITKNYITVGGNTFGVKNLTGIKSILTKEQYEQNSYKL